MPQTAVHSPARAEWFAARALLAMRRLRPLAPLGVAAVVLAFAAVMAWRGAFFGRGAAMPALASSSGVSPPDTAALARAVGAARAELSIGDSVMQALAVRAELLEAPAMLSTESQRTRDSLRTVVSVLDDVLDRASKAPLSASYRALAATRALRPVASVPGLVDSLDALDRMRLTLDPVETPQSVFAQLTQRTNGVGESLQALSRARRATLAREIAGIEARVATSARADSLIAATITARAAVDSARATLARAEGSLREATDSLATAEQRTDSTARADAARALGAPPEAFAAAALVLTAVLVFSLAVGAELRRPTIAHAREAERLTGVPVHRVAASRQRVRRRPARGSSGEPVDSFRLAYLTLTASGDRASGVRERPVCVTGDDAGTVAMVVGRLAMSSATDDRATLVVDLAPGVPGASRYFAERQEPGFTEAIAGIRLWREVARPVGANEGLAVDVVPAGARRADTQAAVESATNRSEFHLFASEYDLTLLAAPTPEAVACAAELCQHPVTVHVARVAKTTLASLVVDVRSLRALNVELYGILLVDS